MVNTMTHIMVGFIDAHAKDAKPFFLYYAFAHTHVNMFNNEECVMRHSSALARWRAGTLAR